MKKKIIISCFGRRNNYLTPNYLNKKNYLMIMFTDIYIGDFTRNLLFKINKFFKLNLLDRLYLRSNKNLPSNIVISFPFIRVKSLIKVLLNKFIYKNNNDSYYKFIYESKIFNQNIIHRLSLISKNFFFYSYRNDSLEAFNYLRKTKPKVKKILEVPIAPAIFEKKIISKIQSLNKYKWENRIINNKNFNKIIEREKKEIKIADHIVVPSEFVKNKICQFYSTNKKKISVIPYAINEKYFLLKSIKRKSKAKIKVLTVGDVCLRKGVHYVYEVAKKLSDRFEFNWIGKSNLNSLGHEEASKYINFFGEIPNNKISKYLEISDIYFLPSLCEGSSISLYEAYMSRLYLIYSNNCGFELKDYKRKKIVKLNVNSMVKIFENLHKNKSIFDKKSIFRDKINYFSIKKYEKNFNNMLKKI